jgi:hypothetical protein
MKLKGDNEVLIGTYEWDSTPYSYYIVEYCPSLVGADTVTPYDIGTNYSVEILKKGVINYNKNNSIIDQYNITHFEHRDITDKTFYFIIDLKSTTDKSFKQFFIIRNVNIYKIYSFPYYGTPLNYFHKKQ